MYELNMSLAIFGFAAILIALLSGLIKRSVVSEPILAMTIGIFAGPYGAGLLDIAKWGDPMVILEQAARLTLAIGLMGIALRLDRDSVRLLLRPVSLLLILGMLGMWLLSSGIALVFGLPLLSALLLGAIVTPTDPVVASSVVTGKFAQKYLPLRVRDGLSYESGANDGLAYLFVMLPILAMSHPPAETTQKWLLDVLVVGVLLATAIGVLVGFAAAKLLSAADRRGLVANQSMLGYTVAFSLFTLGAAKLVHSDALIAVFAAGLTFNLCSDRSEEHEEENIQEAVSKLFTLPMFVLFGLSLPFSEWSGIGWPLVILVVALLLFRRLPVLAALMPLIGRSFNRADIAFLGWFGPIGIAAIYYATLAHKHTHDPMFWHITSAVVFASILVHGVSAASFTRLHRKHAGAAPDRTKPLDSDA
ncbi:sodium/proton antiporter, CPA1 family [Halopseudomonas xinjiangensis]|uniref:Sodium/proton antiporter, CPA1 family n=1 Tax=Halopseudomonas xinjiangensis TaxID=487184 RepID=A0A1H1Q4P0_9GAMM|nr:cation:proton antiporter [Halopseudomonas xinjiangensis]SDS18217.1 sodium/proton antiporter, CPA1 family [Halopseudomonas xinjiangensis]